MNMRSILLLAAMLCSSICNAQNPYLGLWQGYFTYVFANNTTKTSKFQLQFQQMNADTLYGRVISYSDTDSTKVSGISGTFSAGYKKDENMFYYFGLADKTTKKKIKGVYVFRFSGTGNRTIIGEFYPEVKRKDDPRVTAAFHRLDSPEQQILFASNFHEKLYETKKRNPKYLDCECDDKVYGIIKGMIDEPLNDRVNPIPPGPYSHGQSIREISKLEPEAVLTKIHREVIPFPSVALAKGFDNILYTVTSNSTDKRQPVYAYNPATGRGAYTSWTLPVPTVDGHWYAQWLSGGTDNNGNLYFLTEQADKLVKIDPVTDEVTTIWEVCPLGKPSNAYNKNPFLQYDTALGNFCFDENGYICLVSNTTGTITKIDISGVPRIVEMFAIEGLPLTGFLGTGFGYGDILIQKDAQGVNRTYVTGRFEIFEVDLVRRRLVKAVAQFHNADLAGCNIFKKPSIKPFEPEKVLVSNPPVATVLKPADAPKHSELTPEKPSILNIVFVQSKDEFVDPPAANAEINKWIEKLKINPNMTIKVSGHTDDVGNPEKNRSLSALRAIKVKSYMLSKGIQQGRIAVEGFGGTRPMVPNTSEANMAKNRRVEIDIISK
ncbi:OmpA family protein [Dyadobacter psychrotolerans]|uniref:OmpA family protein n=1 Tax=Dyadobacter psychrotolerans TaxID=2541721 RepID=A0A4R5DSG1_9BACT|nr:OmpA family protein [Dyadobacter psychrotolerans]TDE15200.1 OmpA family protein [Dyadobacter psychrotolerans]